MDYAIFIYRSARRSYLKQLDLTNHEGLRQVLGAFKLLQLTAYTSGPMKYLCNLDVKNSLSNTTQNSNLAHPTHLMTVRLTLNTSNISKEKKYQ